MSIGTKRSHKLRGDDWDMLVEYGVVPNDYKTRGGWLPLVWYGQPGAKGREYGSTYSSTSFDKSAAMVLAKAMAEEMASRYVGDWNVVVRKRAGWWK